MSETKPALQLIGGEDKPAPNPFDLGSLRLSQDFVGAAGVKKLLTHVPVRKPGRQDFIRVHPDAAYRVDVGVIQLKDDDETYLVCPELHAELRGEMVFVSIFTAITRQGVTFLWPVRLQLPDDKPLAWWTSAREAAEMAINQWVRVSANKHLGAYEITAATGLVAEPEWPTLSFQRLIEIGFRDRLVDRLDHPLVQRLRGLV
jgi:hypothetical protein